MAGRYQARRRLPDLPLTMHTAGTDHHLTVPTNRETGLDYFISAHLDRVAAAEISALQQPFARDFGSAIWLAPPTALHVTLMDWVTFSTKKVAERDRSFEQVRQHYIETLEHILASMQPIRLNYQEVRVTSNAVILVARDDGSFARIRSQFLDQVELLPGTRQPPGLVHTTIVRFWRVLPLKDVETITSSLSPDITTTVTEFQLDRFTESPVEELESQQIFKLETD